MEELDGAQNVEDDRFHVILSQASLLSVVEDRPQIACHVFHDQYHLSDGLVISALRQDQVE